MPSDDREDVEAVLRRLREQATDHELDPDRVWALAAGELPPAEARRVAAEAQRSRAAMAELGLATHLLDDRDARVDVDVGPVMHRIRIEQAARRKRRRFRWLAIVGGVAAAAAGVVLQVWSPLAVELPCTVTDVAMVASRGGTARGLQFRVRLEPAQPLHALLFLLAEVDGRAVLLRRHPLSKAVLDEPEYAPWPRNPLPAGPLTLPRRAAPDANLFTLDTATGFVIACWSEREFAEEDIERLAAALESVVPKPMTEAGLTAAFARIEMGPVKVAVHAIRMP